MKRKFLFVTFVWFCFFVVSYAAAQQPKPKQTPRSSNPSSGTEAQEKTSVWRVRVASAEKIKPGTENEPSPSPGESILKVGVKFQYTGAEGEISAPVLKVTDGAGKDYVMLGNLQGSGGFDCFEWLISASHVVLGGKPKTLASSTIAKCKDATFYYYFVLPETPKPPLALVFGDAKPLPLTLK